MNLTYDVPLIAVSLAATVHGEVVAGAVVDVWRDEVFSAAAGSGARRDGEAIAPSAVRELSQALVATGFDYSSDGRAAEVESFGRVLPAARDIRCFGSSALHLCWVACGRIDAYYQRNMKRWDYAAGAIVAVRIGGAAGIPIGTERPAHGGGQPPRVRAPAAAARLSAGSVSVRPGDQSRGAWFASRQARQMLTRSAFWTGSDMRATARTASHRAKAFGSMRPRSRRTER